jgi:hypothetical protein
MSSLKPRDIAQQYKKMALLHHPDRYPGGRAGDSIFPPTHEVQKKMAILSNAMESFHINFTPCFSFHQCRGGDVNTFKLITEAYKALLLAKQKEEEEDQLCMRHPVVLNKQDGYGLNLRDEGLPPLNRPMVRAPMQRASPCVYVR